MSTPSTVRRVPRACARSGTPRTRDCRTLDRTSGRANLLAVTSVAAVAFVAGTLVAIGARWTAPALQGRVDVMASTAQAGMVAALDQPSTPEPAPGQPLPPPDAPPMPVEPPAEPEPAPGPRRISPAQPPIVDPLGRRVDNGAPTKLSFRNVSVEQVIPFIVESTGKVVLPQTDVLARRITLLSDREISRQQALDLVFLALQQAGVAVVESRELILLRDQAEVDRQSLPVLGPDESVLDRADLGSVVQKVFLLRHGQAANLGEVLKPSIPDYAKLAVDADSNQLLITGPIALLQRLERVIVSLDRPAAAALVTETFFLEFSDAEQIANNIRDLFADGVATQRRATTPQQQAAQRGLQPGQRPPQQAQPGVTTSANLRVTSNTQQNSVTVLAEQAVIDQIRRLIATEWDRQVEAEQIVPRVFQLRNTDPVKIKDALEAIYGQGTQTTVGTQGGQRNTALVPSVGRLAGQFSFQALPDSGRLVVSARSAANFAAIEQLIQELDQPSTSGLPEIVELKHANAEDLAEQLNALLAQEGTLASVRRSDTSLRTGVTSLSPFASNAATADQSATQVGDQLNQAGQLQLWWQRARVPTDNAGASNLVAKARIVPVARQNAVMILAPQEYKRSIVSIVEELDKPGRQVLIAAVIAEVTGNDLTALGTRFSNTAITPSNPDNVIGTTTGAATQGNATGPTGFTGQKTDLLPGLFNSSVLNIGVNVSAVLQALAQKQEVKILSEPRIFTADNQEATFFDGQDIPFITQSQPNTQGNLVQSFDYKAVGIQLRVRPRITPERDVDLKVNLQLSSTVRGQTLFGGAIIDRRETTTQLIVQDGQTVVISGILRSEDTDIRRKIPVLGDIPLINFLFSSTERTRTTSELVAFITPIVVNNRSESDRVNDPYRDRLGELRRELPQRPDLDAKP
jgi:type II secretion system protein D